MHRIFYSENKAYMRIEEKEIVQHLVNALRIKKGEQVEVVDDNQVEHIYEVVNVEKKALEIQLVETLNVKRESPIEIVLFQGLPKASKLETIIQKTTELGIDKIIPVLSHRVNVKWDGKKNKVERWERIALEAAKQSKRLKIPQVSIPLEFDDVEALVADYDLFLVLYENQEGSSLKSALTGEFKRIGVFVGPEGGIESKEVERLVKAGAVSIGLGPRILRTETAGMAVCAMIQYELGDINDNGK